MHRTHRHTRAVAAVPHTHSTTPQTQTQTELLWHTRINLHTACITSYIYSAPVDVLETRQTKQGNRQYNNSNRGRRDMYMSMLSRGDGIPPASLGLALGDAVHSIPLHTHTARVCVRGEGGRGGRGGLKP